MSKLTDRELKAIMDSVDQQPEKIHDKHCPWRNRTVPPDVCSCTCYEFALIQAGAYFMRRGILK